MDTVTVSTAIMTHPARLTGAERLRDEHPELNAVVVVDPRPAGPRTGMRAARLAWAAVGPGVSHHLVLQDDVRVPPQFAGQLHEAVAARPRDALSLFSEWGSRSTQAARIAALGGYAWVEVMADYVPSQALVMPARDAVRLAEFLVDKCTEYEHDDAAISRYLGTVDVPAALAVANIVDHLDVPSVHGHDSWGARPSGCYLPDPATRRDFPGWTGPVFRPGVVPYLSRVRYRERPSCLVRRGAADGWDSRPATEYLTDRGLPADEVLTGLWVALARSPGADALRREVGHGILHDVWLVSLVLGVAFADAARLAHQAAGAGVPDGVARLNRGLSTSVARRSLATLAGGALRDRLEPEPLERLAPAFEHLVRQGVAQAARHAMNLTSKGVSA